MFPWEICGQGGNPRLRGSGKDFWSVYHDVSRAFFLLSVMKIGVLPKRAALRDTICLSLCNVTFQACRGRRGRGWAEEGSRAEYHYQA